MKIRLNVKNLTEAKMDEKGRAMLLRFGTYKGQHDVELEVELDSLSTMLKILYGYAALAGEHVPSPHTLPAVPLTNVLLLPAEEIEARTTAQGGVWLLTRTGALDTAVALPDPRAAQLLAQSLLAAAPK